MNNEYETWTPQPQLQHMQRVEGDPAFQQGVTEAEAVGEEAPPADGLTVVTPPAEPPAPVERTFTAEDIEKARRQEKDKVYGEVETLKGQVTALTAAEQERQRVAREAEEAAAEAERLAQEAEMSAKELIEQKEREWTERFERIEQERAAERAIADKEQELLRLQSYVTQVRAANAESILPELLDLVGGDTQEAVDASVVALQQRSESILQNVGAAMGDQVAPPPPPRGASVTAPPVGPSDTNSDNRTFTADEIAGMSMSDYAKHRQGLLQSANRRVSETGLYT
jgi:hypothetical protein